MRRFALTGLVFRMLLSLAGLVSLAGLATAHEGHGHTQVIDGHSPMHYLTEPLHFIPMALVATIVAAAIYGCLRFRKARTESSEPRSI